jgi:hypothetical protein
MPALWMKLGDVAPAAAWTTLDELAARLGADPDLPPLDPDDFLYAATVARPGLADLHVFRHVLTGGYLDVDDDGALWRFVGRGSGVDGYLTVDDPAEALRRAGLERAERLALRTRRGPRRPDRFGWPPATGPAEAPDPEPDRPGSDGRDPEPALARA